MMHQMANQQVRFPYRVTLSLYPDNWEDLRRAAQHEGLPGALLIEQIIMQWLSHYTPRLDDLPPDDAPEDA